MKPGPKPSGDPICKMSVSPRVSESRAIREAAARAGKTLSRFFVDAALKEAALMDARLRLSRTCAENAGRSAKAAESLNH